MSSLRLPQNRKWRIAIFVGVLCLTAWIVWRITDDEPRYQGHRLRYWYALTESTNATEQARGEAALHAMGTNAVPYLIHVLERGPSKINEWSWKISYRFTNGELDWYPVFDHEDAAYALAIIGPEAVDAAPALIRAMRHHPSSASSPPQAQITLRLIGDGALPHLEKALFDSDKEIQEYARWTLSEFIRYGSYKEMRRIMQRALKHPDNDIRLSSAQRLIDIDHSAAWRILEDKKLQSTEAIVATFQLESLEDGKPVMDALESIKPALSNEQQTLIESILIGLKNNLATPKTASAK